MKQLSILFSTEIDELHERNVRPHWVVGTQVQCVHVLKHVPKSKVVSAVPYHHKSFCENVCKWKVVRFVRLKTKQVVADRRRRFTVSDHQVFERT